MSIRSISILRTPSRASGATDPYNLTYFSYNSYGQLASRYLDKLDGSQVWYLNSLTYDPEGNLEALSANGASQGANAYNVRGELVQTLNAPNPPYRATLYRGANGYMLPRRYVYTGQTYQWGDDDVVLDTLNAVLLSDATFSSDNSPNLWTYDLGGRQVTDTEQFPGPKGAVLQGAANRSYDPENHIYSQYSAPWGVMGCTSYPTRITSDSRNYYWGPNGHPMLINSTTTYANGVQKVVNHTLHWDGDTLLFTTNGAGQLDDLKVDVRADITPLDLLYTGLTFWDRGPGGALIAMHNGNGSTTPTFGDPNLVVKCPYSGAPGGPSSFNWISVLIPYASAYVSAGLLSEPRTDGFYDGLNTIQGARTYNDASQSWTTVVRP